MSHRLWIENRAKDEIRRLPGHVRQQVRRAVKSLINEPRPHDNRRLRVPEQVALEVRRIRLDRWRVVYVVDEEWAEVGILAVWKRPPYDYQDLAELLAELD